ncbi:RNA polymerase sigma factor [candidate division KSB1 bacterium]
MTDKDLMFAVRNGDVEKLSMLFERYKKKLYNYFLRLTCQQQESEDMVQEVFLKMLKYKHTYSGEGLFTTWMFQIAHNTFYDNIKKNRKTRSNQPIDEIVNNIPDEKDLNRSVNEKEDMKILKKALHKLKDTEREVLILSRFQNMKYDEIADLMNCAVGTVKSRVFHAIKNLKKIYFELAGEGQS